MTNPIAMAYRGYLRCFSLFGDLCSGPYHGFCGLLSTLKDVVGTAEFIPSPDATFAEIDRSATRAGEVYRGVGVAVGVLGIAILFCALAPLMFVLSHQVAEIFAVSKVILMVVVLSMLLYGIHSQLRVRWIALRRQAERLRYRGLRRNIAALDVQPAAAGLAAHPDTGVDAGTARRALQAELDAVLLGESSQIAYNARKAKQYLRIEEFADTLGWVGFAMALAAAALHLYWHQPILILFTAFVPTLVGGIHGINQFLRIRELAEHHGKMAERLHAIAKELAAPAAVDDARMVVLARQALQALQDHDAHWEEEVAKHALKAG